VFDRSIFEQWTAADGSQRALRDTTEIRETFAEHGITHVYVNWQELLRYRTSYGYTDFVSPQPLGQLVDRGVLGEPQALHYGRVKDLSEAHREELETWAPSLIRTVGGERLYVAAEVYPVAP
ncbi:MAG: hypothetical protein ACREIV_02880, partial [Planctomycetaceae bacterium]